MSYWNVIMLWFVLCLSLEQVFLVCFEIDQILVLINMEKSGLGLLIFFVKEIRVMIS